LGNGAVGLSSALVNGYNTTDVNAISSENSTAALGMCFGDTTVQTKHMRVFGIEDFWGNINEWVDGLTTDASRNLLISWNSFSGESITAETTTVETGFSSNFSGQPKYV
jgi:hypothetical protein